MFSSSNLGYDQFERTSSCSVAAHLEPAEGAKDKVDTLCTTIVDLVIPRREHEECHE